MSMNMIDLQRRFRELGRLRTGEKGVTQNGKSYPKKRAEWRLTSPSLGLLERAAALYGGEVAVWDGAPGQGRQWELCTGTDTLDVLIPPGEPISQAWELWSGGGCQRRCNGQFMSDGEQCVCPIDVTERLELSKKGEACKPTTRLSVVLPRVPDMGVWRMESHGVNAAVELPGTVDLLRAALQSGRLLPASLRIEQRTSIKDGETRHFIVPVLELHSITMAELQAGFVPAAQIGPAPARETAITGPASAAALPAPKTETRAPTSRPSLPGEAPAAPDLIASLKARMERIEPKVRRIECKAKFIDKFGHPDQLAATQAHAAEAFLAGWEPDQEPAPPAPPVPQPPAEPKKKPLTTAAKLHIHAKDAGLSDADLDALIFNNTLGETTSAKDLNESDLLHVWQAIDQVKAGNLDMKMVYAAVEDWKAKQVAT